MSYRRTFLRRTGTVVGGLALTGSAAANEGDHGRRQRSERDTIDPEDGSFVNRDGTALTLNGESFYFSGTNNFWLADPWTSKEAVTNFFEAAEELGVTTVRTWLFCALSKQDAPHPLQPTTEHVRDGTITEAAGEHFDHVIDQAAKHSIRLIFPLTNYWGAYGGMDAYLKASDTASDDYATADFYTDEDAQEYYRKFVETMLTRENTITGVQYKDDPTIMVWELANEPRAPKSAFDDGVSNVDVLGDWIADASTYIKSIDDNHLVSTGSEGFYADNPAYVYTRQGWEGQSFTNHHAIDTIDVCSLHLYPTSWGKSDVEEFGTHWIREHVQDAREEVGKPVYLGEFGVEVPRNQIGGAAPEEMERRNRIYDEWYGVLDDMDANGALVWQFTLDKRLQYNDGHYIVDDDEDTVQLMRGYAHRLRAKSGHLTFADAKRRQGRLKAFGDYDAPPAPTTLHVDAVGTIDADISWESVTDERTGLAYFSVYVDGEYQLAVHPNSTSTTVGGLSAGTTHEITLTAVDNAGNESAHSDVLAVTTSVQTE
jgi:mannan endo-1,4-beta-mannosidase